MCLGEGFQRESIAYTSSVKENADMIDSDFCSVTKIRTKGYAIFENMALWKMEKQEIIKFWTIVAM